MAQARPEHLLIEATHVWDGIKAELKETQGGDKPLADGAIVPPEELRKVAKWLQQSVTKFGASAAVADGPKDPALQSVSQEVVKSFTAAAGTLLSLHRGAGPCLREELLDVGEGLAQTMDQLGAAVGTPNMAVSAGKVLDRIKHLERISLHNRAATRRRLLMSLAQVRDAGRELSEALKKDFDAKSGHASGVAESDDDLDDDIGDFDQELEPEERRVVEAVVNVITALEDILTKASVACMPAASGSPVSIPELEAAAKNATLAAHAVDGLAAHALGGLDVKAFSTSLKELKEATPSLFGSFSQAHATDLNTTLDAVQVALGKCATTS